MHVVYPVRPGENNDELRHSLRTLEANTPIETVTVVGFKPRWLEPDLYIEGNRYHDKPRNVFDNVRLACEHPDVPDEIVWFNDDFFVLQPVDEIPIHYRGLLTKHLELIGEQHKHPRRQSWWFRSLNATMHYLQEQGIRRPKSYDLHRPLPTVKADMAKALADAADYQPDNPPQWRTLYGNMAHIGGTRAKDVKVYSTKVEHRGRGAFVSTTDTGFATTTVGAHIRGTYATPSRWER